MGDGEPSERPCEVETVSRSLPFPARYGLVAAKAARAARRADVVYASATYAAAAGAAVAARRPLVAKLVSDPAYERARRYGVFAGTLEDFQSAGGARARTLRRLRTTSLRRARRVVVPSAYLATLARGWGLPQERIEVLPNPAPEMDVVPEPPVEPNLFVFAGRLTAQKSLETALAALASLPDARLVVVGDGPERAALERRAQELGLNGRAVFQGARPRAEVLDVLARATAAVLPSAWENLPHTAVEALAVGTPVVATAVGGVPEVVRDGVNGFLVPPGDAGRLAAAMALVAADADLRAELASAARATAAGLSRDRIYGRLEAILLEAAA